MASFDPLGQRLLPPQKFMKKLLMLLLLIMAFVSMSFGEEGYEVFYNGQRVDLPLKTVSGEAEVYGDFEKFARTVQAQFILDSEESEAVLYRNNTFVKYFPGKPLVAVNGKTFSLREPPPHIPGETWVPLRFIAPYFGIDLVLDTDNRTLRMTDQKRMTYRTYENYFYQTTVIPEYNISFDIPYFWGPLSEDAYLYGRDTAFEEILMEVKMLRNLADISLDEFTRDLKRSLFYRFQEADLKLEAEEKMTLSGFSGRMLRYRLNASQEETTLIYYITKVNDLIYEMVFQFPYDDGNYQLGTVDSILRSFQVETFAINPQDEHYVEFANYNNLSLNFTREIYSNLQVDSFLPVAGTCDPDVSRIYVTVEKGTERFSQVIPVVEGAFEGAIPLPFGLGYHSLTLSGAKDTPPTQHVDFNHPSEVLLKVSLINLSDDFIRYSLAESNIPSDNVHIITMGKLITRNTLTDYQRAYTLYAYFLENITLEKDSEIRTAYEVYLNSKGHPTAVLEYFVSLLRSLEIPARLFKGDFEGTSHAWATVYLNGNWRVIDVLKGIETGDYYQYFLLSPEKYEDSYDNITSLTQ
ncbi:MAG: hypothetical protein AVO33_07560 [delta proteobacterium ML8_F1]|nr:MAG: hypothetical protein AVO33_07560 [delta proteobacterium ML8_F1]